VSFRNMPVKQDKVLYPILRKQIKMPILSRKNLQE